mmetsp:Transcript_75179/g.230011  ORF Transcript_75179/g.230011 Transcript_75179/m.230011 type:complete len:401 (-) Transcript_75179:1187-2389(-)
MILAPSAVKLHNCQCNTGQTARQSQSHASPNARHSVESRLRTGRLKREATPRQQLDDPSSVNRQKRRGILPRHLQRRLHEAVLGPRVRPRREQLLGRGGVAGESRVVQWPFVQVVLAIRVGPGGQQRHQGVGRAMRRRDVQRGLAASCLEALAVHAQARALAQGRDKRSTIGPSGAPQDGPREPPPRARPKAGRALLQIGVLLDDELSVPCECTRHRPKIHLRERMGHLCVDLAVGPGAGGEGAVARQSAALERDVEALPNGQRLIHVVPDPQSVFHLCAVRRQQQDCVTLGPGRAMVNRSRFWPAASVEVATEEVDEDDGRVGQLLGLREKLEGGHLVLPGLRPVVHDEDLRDLRAICHQLHVRAPLSSRDVLDPLLQMEGGQTIVSQGAATADPGAGL